MSSLGQLRGGLQEILEAIGVPVRAELPSRFTPPIAILVPGAPYIDAGETYSTFSVRFEVVLIAGTGTSEAVGDRLGSLIQDAVHLINDSDNFYLEQVSQPSLYKDGNATYLAATISVLVNDTLEAAHGG